MAHCSHEDTRPTEGQERGQGGGVESGRTESGHCTLRTRTRTHVRASASVPATATHEEQTHPSKARRPLGGCGSC
eukprot:scaffold16219_cov102-Isochrysis_galbana.AAC.4